MKDKKNPTNQDEQAKKRLRTMVEDEHCKEQYVKELRRIQKDKILDEAEDEEKEYVYHY